jgi:hypothetical protein
MKTIREAPRMLFVMEMGVPFMRVFLVEQPQKNLLPE